MYGANRVPAPDVPASAVDPLSATPPRATGIWVGDPRASPERQEPTLPDDPAWTNEKALEAVRGNLLVWLTACLVSPQLLKSCYSICHIEYLRPVHGALNVDKKIN